MFKRKEICQKTVFSNEDRGLYLTFVVNCTPVFIIRGFCGCVGMHGCFSTTKELKKKEGLEATFNCVHINDGVCHSSWCFLISTLLFQCAENIFYA